MNAVTINREPLRFASGNTYTLNYDHLLETAPASSLDILNYDIYVVFFSGGKDSVATVLELIERGVPREKIELHHHLIDGAGEAFMDWPCTEDYCIKFSQALGLKLYMSWKEGGFLREMSRNNEPTAPVAFQTPEGKVVRVGGKSNKLGTRGMLPAKQKDLRVRWCSAYLKIDVGKKVINQQSRFIGRRTLVITGERGEESANRKKYARLEPHAGSCTKIPIKDVSGNVKKDSDGKAVCETRRVKSRFVDHARLILDWPEEKVWSIIERHKIQPHPAYVLGWGRASCLTCIFGSSSQWATIRRYMPERFSMIERCEKDSGVTLHFKKGKQKSISDVADEGTPYNVDPMWLDVAMKPEFDQPIIVKNWLLPAGAYSDEKCGPA